MATRTAISTRDAQLDLATALLAGGTLRIYSGAQPAGPDVAATGNHLVTLGLSTPAFAAASAGSATAAAISPGTVLVNGTAGWFRLFSSGGAAIYDGAITAGGDGGEIEFDSLTFTAGAQVALDALNLTLPL
jgi:hypothetical protein